MRHEAQLDQPAGPDPKMGSLRAHLEVAARQGSARAIAKLQSPPAPAELVYLLDYSIELASSRRYGQVGPERITFVDIDAWSRLTDRQLAPHEVSALLQIDGVMLSPGIMTNEARS